MAQLHRLESPQGDTTVGGFLIAFDSARKLTVAWRSQAPVQRDQLREAGVSYAKQVAEACQARGWMDALQWTNWPSVAAAIGKLLGDWSDVRRAALFGGGGAGGGAPESEGGSTPSQVPTHTNP